MFSGLTHEKQIRRIFEPVVSYLKNACLLFESDEFAFRVLLERVDDYISHLQEKALYFTEVFPTVLEYEKRELEKKLERYHALLKTKRANNEINQALRLEEEIVATEKALYINSQQARFKSLKLGKKGELRQRTDISTATVTKDLIEMLKSNALTNIVRTKLQNSLKLETQQKSIAEILGEMIQTDDDEFKKSILN